MERHVGVTPTRSATRRMFFGTAAGVGLGSVAAVLSGAAQAQIQVAPHVDSIQGEIVDQLLAAVRSLQSAPSGEAARQVASSLRLLAAWGKGTNVNATIRHQLSEAVRRTGRDGLLSQPFDLAAELTLRGWKVPPGATFVTTPSHRVEALNELLRDGITSRWLQCAKAFEDAGTQLDRRSGSAIALVSQSTNCDGIRAMQLMLDSQAFFFCVFMSLVPELCIIATASAIGWGWYAWYQGC